MTNVSELDMDLQLAGRSAVLIVPLGLIVDFDYAHSTTQGRLKGFEGSDRQFLAQYSLTRQWHHRTMTESTSML